MRFLGNNLCRKQEADRGAERGEQADSRAPKESNGGGDEGLVRVSARLARETEAP